MEVEAGVREKPPVLVKRETTAQTLRADYEMRLSHLQPQEDEMDGCILGARPLLWQSIGPSQM